MHYITGVEEKAILLDLTSIVGDNGSKLLDPYNEVQYAVNADELDEPLWMKWKNSKLYLPGTVRELLDITAFKSESLAHKDYMYVPEK